MVEIETKKLLQERKQELYKRLAINESLLDQIVKIKEDEKVLIEKKNYYIKEIGKINKELIG